MNVISLMTILIIPCFFLVGLVIGLVVFFVVRKREKRRRAEFHQAQTQAAQKLSQEKELEKMKLDDL